MHDCQIWSHFFLFFLTVAAEGIVNSRKLHWCRPVRDCGHVAAAWGVFVPMRGCHSSPCYTCMMCECWDSCLCMVHCGGWALRDALVATSTTGDTHKHHFPPFSPRNDTRVQKLGWTWPKTVLLLFGWAAFLKLLTGDAFYSMSFAKVVCFYSCHL